MKRWINELIYRLICKKGIESFFDIFVFFPNEVIEQSLIYRIPCPVYLRDTNVPNVNPQIDTNRTVAVIVYNCYFYANISWVL